MNFQQKTLRKKYGQFLAGEKGSLSLLFGLSLMPIFAILAISIDYGRAFDTRQRIGLAIDAAALAVVKAGHSLRDQDNPLNQDMFFANQQTYVRSFLLANLGGKVFAPNKVSFVDSLSGAIGQDELQIKIGRSGNGNKPSISIEARAQVPTLFEIFKSPEDRAVDTFNATKAVQGVSGLEAVFAVDLSGSMLGTPLSNVQEASRNLTDILIASNQALGSTAREDLVRIGVVPWTANVRVPGGPSHSKSGVSIVRNVKIYDPDAQDNDMFDYANSYPLDGLMPFACGNGSFKYFNREVASSAIGASIWDNVTDTKYILDQTSRTLPVLGSYSFANFRSELGFSKYEDDQYVCPSTPPLDLETNDSTIKNKIDSFTADGGTDAASGIYWAMRMLDPDDTVFKAENAPFPGKDNKSNLGPRKVIVLLSDGATTQSQNKGRPPYSSWDEALRNEYVQFDSFEEENYGNYPVSEGQENAILSEDLMLDDGYKRSRNGRILRMCQQVRAKNVTIYSIAFNISSTTEKNRHALLMLRHCSSTTSNSAEKYYFNASDNDELKKAFSTIGASLQRLRLTQ